jgi:hypothetical protein
MLDNPSFLKGELLWLYRFLLEMSYRRNAYRVRGRA